jgi:hypothetical protein
MDMAEPMDLQNVPLGEVRYEDFYRVGEGIEDMRGREIVGENLHSANLHISHAPPLVLFYPSHGLKNEQAKRVQHVLVTDLVGSTIPVVQKVHARNRRVGAPCSW